jgi:hypothetical protein
LRAFFGLEVRWVVVTLLVVFSSDDWYGPFVLVNPTKWKCKVLETNFELRK